MIGDKIGDYTVTDTVTITIGNTKFVLGENPQNSIAPFATWQANVKNNEQDYFWGHYTDSRESAMRDFGERISREAEYQKNIGKSGTRVHKEREG